MTPRQWTLGALGLLGLDVLAVLVLALVGQPGYAILVAVFGFLLFVVPLATADYGVLHRG